MTQSSPHGLFAEAVLTVDGWARNVSIYFDTDGTIKSAQMDHRDTALAVAVGPVIPGMVNIHSHAFQREMVGMTHSFTDPYDDFWSWRRAMYAFVDRLTPDSYRVQAEALYREMLANGYTSVCEFHYIHNDPNGRPYSDPAAMSVAVIEAAKAAGIRLCLLPVLYTYGGFGSEPLTGGQLRFQNTPSSYGRLMERLAGYETKNDFLTIGYAPHSLRAVSIDGLSEMLAHRAILRPASPVHMHIAEQTREVDQCLIAHKARPVEFLFDSADVSEKWCMIHATHLIESEIGSIAASGAAVGLCPTTESDLGDGVFSLREYVARGGAYGIGSDSNVSVSPGEELRFLEAMQRSTHRVRNVDGLLSSQGIGTTRYQQAVSAGRSASGAVRDWMTPGAPADFVILDATSDLLGGKTTDEMLNAHLFSGSSRTIDSVLVNGRIV